MNEKPAECWVRCTRCKLDFRLGVSVPCLLEIYIAALKIIRCPKCGKRGKTLHAYSPGLKPAVARKRGGFEVHL